jgi:bacillithiol system protein YtxJ
MNWQNLNSLDQLHNIDKESDNVPVLIFKHSTRCSISSAALDRLERKWNLSIGDNVQAYFLDIIDHRAISNAIADHYGVYHQSPQALLIYKRKVIYDDSHFSIDYDEIASHIKTVKAA